MRALYGIAIVSGGLMAAAALGADAGALLEEEAAQSEVGYVSAAAADGFRLLAEELETNFTAEKAESPRRGVAVLNEISEEDVPAILASLRRLQRTRGSQRRALARTVTKAQDEILEKIAGLVDSGLADIEADTLRERVAAAVEAQETALEETREIARRTIGKSAADLSAEERVALEEVEAGQKAVTVQLAEISALAGRTVADESADAGTRKRVADALERANLDEARSAARAASKAIAENRLGTALTRQDAALRYLDAFGRALAGEEAAGPEKRLERLLTEEKAIADETARARLPREMAALAGRQERLQKETANAADDIADNVLATLYADAAAEEMAEAASALEAKSRAGANEAGDSLKRSAAQSQTKALQYLEGAKAALADGSLGEPFEAVAGKLRELDETAAELADLDRLIGDQETLKEKASESEATAREFEKLAAEEIQLAGRASQMSKTGQDGGDESGQAPAEMADAAEAMSKAAEALESAKADEAAESQEEALDSMRRAREKLSAALAEGAEELAQAAQSAGGGSERSELPPEAEQILKEAQRLAAALKTSAEASALGRKERELASETKKLPATSKAQQSAASRQDQLSRQAAALRSGGKDLQAFARAVTDARAEMAEASESLRGGKPQSAGMSQSRAAAHLESASRAALAAARESLSRAAQSRAPGRTGTGGPTGLARGAAGDLGPEPDKNAWLATLPPETPPEVMQAASGPFPRGYEESLRRYFETISRRESER